MRRVNRGLLSGLLAGALLLSPVSMVTVSAHGHHGGNGGHHGGQSNSNVTYYCGGHGAHCHENGVCPYAGEVDMSLAPTEVKVPDKGIEEPGYLSAIGSGELRKRDRSNLLVRSKNVCLGRIGYLR